MKIFIVAILKTQSVKKKSFLIKINITNIKKAYDFWWNSAKIWD